uniref:Uncharacterized protein n=1 Tax=Colobus angolensis palliatus TaxID=336983 RepID=A0A2K5HIW0_COLAP
MGCACRPAGPRGSPVKGSGEPHSLWAWGGSGLSLCGLAVAVSLHPPCQPGTGPVKTQEQLQPQPNCPPGPK